MRRLILGTAGHIDHGKTALIRALTGTDTDRLPDEKRRGITIDIGFARMGLPDDTEVGIIDVPGHEGFVRNMLAGATGIDIALLVVAADEGVMPQTREHTAILELLGVRSLVVALTKIDLVEPEWSDLAADDVRALLHGGPFAGAPIVPVSARTAQGLDLLVDEIAGAAAAAAQRTESDLFRLPIDRIFTVHGTGTVVTGTVWSGRAGRDDILRLLPADRTVRIRALQSHGQEREQVRAGERAALALAATGRESMERGDVLVGGDGWEASSRLTLRLRAIDASEPGLKHGQRIRFHLATAEIIGRLATAGRPLLAPGDDDWMQVRLERPVVARAGDPFVIRSFSPVTTVGGGRVAEPAAPRRKRLSPTDRDDLAAVLGGEPAAAVSARIRLAGWAGEPLAVLATRTPHSPDAVLAATRAGQHAARDGRIFHPEVLAEARRILLAFVDRHHATEPLSPGARLDRLRSVLPPAAPPSLVPGLLAELAADGSLVTEGNRARRADHRPRLDSAQVAAAEAILAEFGRAGLAPPATAELPAALTQRADLDDLLHHLVRAGQLLSLGPGLYMAPAAFRHAAHQAAAAFGARPGLTPGDFRDLFGISRKYLIPLLEHFDRTGVTEREGEGRRVVEPGSGGS